MNGKASNQIMNLLNQENASASVQKLVDSNPYLKHLSPTSRFNLMASVDLLTQCFSALNFLDEVGHEKALLRCAMECVEIVQHHQGLLQGGLFKDLVSKVQQCHPL